MNVVNNNPCNTCRFAKEWQHLEPEQKSTCGRCVGFRAWEATNEPAPASTPDYGGMHIHRRILWADTPARERNHTVANWADTPTTGLTFKKPKALAKYLPLANEVAKLSKDWSSKVGALVIGPDGESGPWGYNGAVRGCAADEDERKDSRETKNLYAEHAERNAIYAAARTGFKVHGCSMVVTHFPCMDCARAIVQAGIVKVVCPSPEGEFAERWKSSIDLARGLFDECGVELEEIPL